MAAQVWTTPVWVDQVDRGERSPLESGIVDRACRRLQIGDISSPKLIVAKGFLFLLAGIMAVAALLLEHPTLKVAFLVGLAIWCFARFYYFAFYVIEHYVDSSYRFAGLGSFALYLWRRWRARG